MTELSDLDGAEIHDLSKTERHLRARAAKLNMLCYPEALVDHKATSKKAKRRVYELQKGLQHTLLNSIALDQHAIALNGAVLA